MNIETANIEPEMEPPIGQMTLMKKPFDPTLINITTKTPSLDTLIKRIKYKEIDLETSTYFQRADNLWSTELQSRLIESILIRFPLPAFYLDGSNNNKWLVVDGLQRLSSIRNFVVTQSLKLTNLEFLTHLEGLKFNDLDRDLQRIIEETHVVIYIINPGTPSDVKFNIFKRINTGGLVLESQEIRHALFQGVPAQFIEELGDCEAFKEATAQAFKQDRRMIDRDFANRFLGFYLFGFEAYEPDLDTFMSKAMAAIVDFSKEKKEAIKADYIASMELNKYVFGKYAFRKIDDTSKRKPINKAVFDAFAVQFAVLTAENRILVKKYKDVIVTGFKELLKNDQDFFWAVSSATGDKNKVIYRHTMIQKLIQNSIQTKLYDSIY